MKEGFFIFIRAPGSGSGSLRKMSLGQLSNENITPMFAQCYKMYLKKVTNIISFKNTFLQFKSLSYLVSIFLSSV